MHRALTSAAVAVAALSLSACATTSYNSTWRAPDAPAVGSMAGKKVVGVVMTKNEGARRGAEDALARELTRNGVQGVPSYSIIPANATEDEAKAALQKAGVAGVVVLRPVSKDKEVVGTPSMPMYTGPRYGGYWGGYYGYGWGGAWGGGTDIRTNTIVTVETLVYSLESNKLIWAGQSQTTNPSKVDSFVREIVSGAVKEIKKGGGL
jgi:hypothetical protein